MTKEQKPYFEIMNTFWNILKPYAIKEDEQTYKKIMSDFFNMLIKDRGKKFTEAWYKSTQEFVDYPDRYKNTKYVEFAAELAIAITDYMTFEYKMTHQGERVTYYDFSRYISKAFINEWERIRGDEKKTKA